MTTTNLSLELLLLNDLFRTNVIDKSIYDAAVKKITTKQKNNTNGAITLASA